MSKDRRFNKKEYGYDDDTKEYTASSKQSSDKKQMLEQQQKSNFNRTNKRESS